MTTILGASAALMGTVAVFLLVTGIYETFLKRFFAEVGDQADSSFMKGVQKVVLSKLGVINRRFMSDRFEARTRQKLVKGGDPSDLQPEEIMGLQEIGIVGGIVIGVYVCVLTGWTLVIVVFLAFFGWLYPLIWLNDQVKKRHHLIKRALPYNIDLLTLSVEAGLDFTAALAKVVEKGKQGPLVDEFGMVLKQLKMGKTREDALKQLIDRVDLQQLTSFITSLIQADRMGTSIGKVLRIQSTQMRIERTQRAEKLANEAPVKMLFPLIACIFPTVFAVLFGPIDIQFMYGGMGQ